MVRVMVPPIGTVVSGVKMRTGATVAPETWESRLMDVKAAIAVSARTYSAEKSRQNTRTPILIDCIMIFFKYVQRCYLALFWPSFVYTSADMSY